VTIRNNVFYDANTVGISIGGYSNAVGGSDHVIIVNNTLYNDNTKNQGGEFQIQYHTGSQSGNIFENNIVYAGTQNVWIYSYVKATTTYPAPPATLNWNLYYSTAGYVSGTSIDWADKYTYKTFMAYQSGSGEDADSIVANPLFDDAGSNFDVESGSRPLTRGAQALLAAWDTAAAALPSTAASTMRAIHALTRAGRSILERTSSSHWSGKTKNYGFYECECPRTSRGNSYPLAQLIHSFSVSAN
jgi:hypothetical protein